MTNIKHVATLAGVSASTVSQVLNGKSYVNETTRQKVMEAVQRPITVPMYWPKA